MARTQLLGRGAAGDLMTTYQCVVVVPCFNEARRLPEESVRQLVRDGPVRVLLVDDGSTDGTLKLLERLSASSDAIDFLALPVNGGKGEAVRHGMLAGIQSGAAAVGYVDADFATPSDEVRRLVALLDRDTEAAGILGSRVMLSGRRIERSSMRHLIGRAVATYLSLSYRLRVYDTQCGAKFFRNTPELRRSLSEPFATRWLFDVELMLRLRVEYGRPVEALMREEPLEQWTHVKESRLGGSEVVRLVRDFLVLRRGTRRSPAGFEQERTLSAQPGLVPDQATSVSEPIRRRA